MRLPTDTALANASFSLCFITYPITDVRQTQATATFHALIWLAFLLPCHGLLCLMSMLLAPSAAAEWAKPSRSAAAHLPVWRVRVQLRNSTNRARASLPGVGSADSETLCFFSCFLTISTQMCAKLGNSRNLHSPGLPPQTPPDARSSSHSNFCLVHLASDAQVCRNVSPYDCRRCDMQKRNSISPSALKHA